MTEFDAFISAFRYKRDSRHRLFGGQWRILTVDDPEGDCEDFALGVSWIIARKSWRRWLRMLFTRKFQIWTGDSYLGNRHATLYSQQNGGWIDNFVPYWSPTTPHDMKRAYHPLYVLYRLLPRRLLFGALALAIVGGLAVQFGP